MRLARVLILSSFLLACLAFTSVKAWDKDDYEIFEIQQALETDEGKGTTFYSILNLTSSATQPEIRKAYRKRSLELHPDKNPGVANAQRRFERLGLINKILRDERKDRYDHFLSKGFPKWRGTGYFYSRFRPGLATVLAFLCMVSAAFEYLFRLLNWRRDEERLERLVRSAKLLALGPNFEAPGGGGNLKPGLERKVRVPLSGFPDLPPRPSSKEVESGKVDWEEEERKMRKALAGGGGGGVGAATRINHVEVVVSSEGVFALDPATGDRLSLDSSTNPRPSLIETWPFACVKSVLSKLGIVKGSGNEAAFAQDADEDSEEEVLDQGNRRAVGSDSAAASSSSNGAASSGSAKKRKGRKGK
ncbi:DnaJ-domain-containing protein [Violaceomyces palustris]|uniref:DnaJ-domain-containing protein n=1 Tax=Violaceomyces palustris TaxID=1673888 RepID=A0ACD0NSM3_9BASI|nr:DnaJ-domain-containing protein [Violaceomyces palustris]